MLIFHDNPLTPISQMFSAISKHPATVLRYTRCKLLRCYPNNLRVDSSNYDPMALWNVGVQMVALNYQTVRVATSR